MFSGTQKEKSKVQKRFGKHLREVLKRKGVTQSELSKRTLMDRSQINDILRGDRNITIYTLTLICTELEMSLSEFFDGFEEKKEK